MISLIFVLKVRIYVMSSNITELTIYLPEI